IVGVASSDNEWLGGIKGEGSSVEISYLQITNNLVTDINGNYVDLECDIEQLLVAGNQLVETSRGLGGNHLVIDQAVLFTVTGNVLRNGGNGTGIQLGADCRYGAVVGNSLLGFLYAIELLAGVINTTVDANRIFTVNLPIRDLALSVTNRIQGAPVAIEVERGTSAQTFTDTTAVKVQFNNVLYDPYSTYDASTNYRWSPGVAGTYQITATVTVAMPGAGGSAALIALYKNGSEVARGVQLPTESGSTYALTISTVQQ